MVVVVDEESVWSLAVRGPVGSRGARIGRRKENW
jgi:hypothetical protein